MRSIRALSGLIAAVMIGAVSLGGWMTPVAYAQQARPDGWQSVGEGVTSGVSGAVITESHAEQTEALLARDNKEADENRIIRVKLVKGSVAAVEPLQWSGEIPVDLESLEALPGRKGEFIALASKGKGFHVRAEVGQVSVLRIFQLPAGASGDNYESFALTGMSGRLVAVWADRGQDSRPATVYAAELHLEPPTFFGSTTKMTVRVPYPQQNVRHVSDIEVTSTGKILISSASDPGNDGPFDSAVYDVGNIKFGTAGIQLPADPAPYKIATFGGRKIEALTCISPDCEHLLLGSDDENSGGSLLVR